MDIIIGTVEAFVLAGVLGRRQPRHGGRAPHRLTRRRTGPCDGTRWGGTISRPSTRRARIPWRLATSDYERAKYAATLAALPRPRYARGFEVGCALGLLTAELGRRCDDLLAVEPVAAALAAARARNADQPHIRFAPLFVPGEWPDERFDLVVLSEVIDYLGAEDVDGAGRRASPARSSRGGDVVMVHWVGKKRGPPSGDEASRPLRRGRGRSPRGAPRRPQSRLPSRRPAEDVSAGLDERLAGQGAAARGSKPKRSRTAWPCADSTKIAKRSAAGSSDNTAKP